MSSHFSVLSPNYRGTKKYNLLVTTKIVVESNFTDYQGVKLLNRDASLICDNKFNRIIVKVDGDDNLFEVKEASYTVLKDNYNIGVIDALIAFDIFANSAEQATDKMRRTLDGDVVIKDFTLSDMDTYNMDFDCDVILFEFDHEYLVKEITHYDETPKKYEQLASLKVIVKGDIPKFIEGMDGELNFLYKSDNLNYKFEGFKLSIDGLKKIDYKLLPISFKTLEEDGLTEFIFAFNFDVYGYSPDHATDQFESLFTPDNITIKDFTFINDENFIASKLEVIKITDTTVEDLAQ